MTYVTLLLFGLVILGSQYFLSRRNNTYWGAILPVIYFAFFSYASLSGLLKGGNGFSKFLIVFGGTSFLLSIWVNGRQAVKDKRKKELEKMELYDM